jgi:hypothetical protein
MAIEVLQADSRQFGSADDGTWPTMNQTSAETRRTTSSTRAGAGRSGWSTSPTTREPW